MYSTTLHHLRNLYQLDKISRSQMVELAVSWSHSPHIRRHRADVIIARVRLVCAIFAVCTPLWIIVDIFAFDWPLWFVMAMLRMGSGAVFIALAWPYDTQKSMAVAYMMLACMLAVPPAFYLISRPFLLELTAVGWVEILLHAYSILPYIVVAGLSLFPLTIVEVLLFAVVALMASTLGFLQTNDFDLIQFANTMWLMLLVLGASMFSGVGQLHYLISLVNKAAIDPLTEAFTRRSGEEIIDLQFRIAGRQDTPIAVTFIDIDDFKSINDTYGHEEGDRALRSAAMTLKGRLRRSDTLVRWGGEEFVILLPNTGSNGINTVIDRLHGSPLGNRPDGKPLTASVGIAERMSDGIEDWTKLLELADERMYLAKKSGKNRCIGFGNKKVG